MKKLIVLLLILASVSFSQVTSLTSSFKLARWTAGNRLYAGTIGDTAQANASLNYNFDRIEAVIGRYIKEDGRFSGIGGYGSGNLDINAGTSAASAVRITLSDSLYGYYNWTTEGNLWVQGNATIGGYLTTDSIIITGGNLWLDGNITQNGNLESYGWGSFGTVYADSSMEVGQASVFDGYIDFYSGLVSRRIRLKVPTTIASSSKTVYLPDDNGTLATTTASDSIQTPTIYTVLYNSPVIADSTTNDTSDAFVEWKSTSGDNVPIVRLKYLHRSGMKYVSARYYAYVAAGDGWTTSLIVGSLSGTDTDGNASYGSTIQEIKVDVSGLTTNTLYDLKFNIGIDTIGKTYVKELVITAESN